MATWDSPDGNEGEGEGSAILVALSLLDRQGRQDRLGRIEAVRCILEEREARLKNLMASLGSTKWFRGLFDADTWPKALLMAASSGDPELITLMVNDSSAPVLRDLGGTTMLHEALAQLQADDVRVTPLVKLMLSKVDFYSLFRLSDMQMIIGLPWIAADLIMSISFLRSCPSRLATTIHHLDSLGQACCQRSWTVHSALSTMT